MNSIYHRLGALVVAGCILLLSVVACGGSGTHTQSFSPSPSLSTTDSSSSTIGSTTPATDPPSSGPTSGVPAPSVTPPAQSAVDAYYAFFNADIKASRDPAHADLRFVAMYETASGDDLRR